MIKVILETKDDNFVSVVARWMTGFWKFFIFKYSSIVQIYALFS